MMDFWEEAVRRTGVHLAYLILIDQGYLNLPVVSLMTDMKDG
jgi:hypothetical protein